jgi:hypothetical protein
MKRGWVYLWVSCLAFCAIVSCKPNSADLPAAQAKTGYVAFFNLIPNGNPIDFYVNGTRLNANKIGFDEYSGYMATISGQQSIVFKQDSLRYNLFDPVTTYIDSTYTTIFVSGNASSNLVYARDTAVVDTKNYKPKLRFVNASATSPALDFTVNSTVISNVAYKGVSTFARVDTGKVTLTLKQTGGSTNLISTTLTLSTQKVYTMFVYGTYSLTGASSLNLGIIANH